MDVQSNVDWVTGLVRHARDQHLTRVEATTAGVTSWTDYVKALGTGLLSNEVDSWVTGINTNVAGKQRLSSQHEMPVAIYKWAPTKRRRVLEG